MPSSDLINQQTAVEVIEPVEARRKIRVAFSNHIKLLAFLVAVYALIFNKAMHPGGLKTRMPGVNTAAATSPHNVMNVSYTNR